MMEERYTERRNLARERIVNSQRGKHVSRQDIQAEHMNKAKQKYLFKELNVVSSQKDVSTKVRRHETDGFVSVQRQGVGGLVLHGMYRKLAEDHFRAVDRITRKASAKPDAEPDPAPAPEPPPAVAPAPARPERLSTFDLKLASLRESVSKPPEGLSDKRRRRRARRERPSGEEAPPDAPEDVIAAISAANAAPRLPTPPRRKYGVYRRLRSPVFMQALASAAEDEQADAPADPGPPPPPAQPWRLSTTSSASGRSSLRVSFAGGTALPPVEPAEGAEGAEGGGEVPRDAAKEKGVKLPQLPHPPATRGPELRRPRRRRKAPPPGGPVAVGPFMRLLFREEEMQTFQRLKRKLFLERHRMQHRLSARRCSGHLRDWMARNPADPEPARDGMGGLVRALQSGKTSRASAAVDA